MSSYFDDCLNCPDRALACSDTCERYAKNKEKHNKNKHKYSIADEFSIDAIEKRRKRK
jgi:hypothetical protein